VESSSTGIGSNNVGNKMMRAMGWREGVGLGRESNGITAPIGIRKVSDRAGLGAGPSTDEETQILPTDSYKNNYENVHLRVIKKYRVD